MVSVLRYFLLFVASFFWIGGHSQFYSGSNVEFGKNRIQYRDFEWFYLPSDRFEVYFYQGGRQLAEYTLLSAERNLAAVEDFFDYSMDDKIQVLTYQKQSEFRQSNVGISSDDQYNIGGVARILGNKMFLYYEGSHTELEVQIRQNLSRVVFMQMMYGGDWKDVLKSSTMLSMPEWFEEGIIAYSAEGFSTEAQAYSKDLASSSRFKTFNRLTGEDARLAGMAFWNYIAEVYGENVIPNILYMTRISRNVDNGFLFVLGLSLDSVTQEFLNHYREKYRGDNDHQAVPGTTADPRLESEAPTSQALKEQLHLWRKEQKRIGGMGIKQKKKYTYSEFLVSPDQRYAAFVTNEYGQSKIWIYDFEKGSLTRVVKKEYKLDRLVDRSYPVLAWHPSSKVLAYTFENQGRAFIGSYNLEDHKKLEKELMRIDKVIDMQYSPDGRRMVFSGVREGQTDLYLYQVIGNNPEQLTRDIWDDMRPSFIHDGESILFASNRPDDTLRAGQVAEHVSRAKDLFVFDLESRSPLLERITNSPDIDEDYAHAYDAVRYTFLTDAQGVYNRGLATVDSTISAIDTAVHYRYFTVSSLLSNYPRNALCYQFHPSTGDYSVVFRKDNRYILYRDNSRNDRIALNPYTGTTGANSPADIQTGGIYPMGQKPLGEGDVDINHYVFEDERKDYTYEKESIRLEELDPHGETAADTAVFVMPKPRNYRLNFATDYVLTQVDNTFTQQFYQNYTGPTSTLPGISGLIKLGISDLFEDYKIVGGFRLALDLQNNEYGLVYENLKHRWDKKITLMRQGQVASGGFNLFKVQTQSAQYQLKYPFSELASFRINLIYRNDRIVTLSIDPLSLAEQNQYENNVGVRFEYVFDNTRSRGLNLFNGTRYKFWVERYQQPDQVNTPTDFNVAGFDIRHYEKIHRDFIAAFRLAGGTSFGQYKLIHYLGGVDNWLFQRIDNSIPLSTDQNYSYQTLASPLRGFWVNSRNGNSFAVANAELRFPLFRYFMRKPIRSDFLQNFQLVTFADAGSAWTGSSPYSKENSLNLQVIEKYPVTVTINNNREPIIYGYGFGVRSRVLGYFMRADWAWGVDDGKVLPRVFYLSLNLDF